MTPETPTTPEATPPAEPVGDKPSLLNEPGEEPKPEDKPAGAPSAYEPFKAPEGFEINEELITEASGLFKEMNLSQDQAQKLVDFYSKNAQSAAEEPVRYWRDLQDQWRDQISKDPEIGGTKLNQVRSTIGKAIDSLPADVQKPFRAAMDLTGAGNHPAFVKAFYHFARQLTEGGAVQGGPAGAGAKPASAAAAIYPNNPAG